MWKNVLPYRWTAGGKRPNTDTPYRRDVGQPWLQKYYCRDWELTGDPYRAQGLESLSDKPTITGIDWKKYGKGKDHSFYGTTLNMKV